MMKITILPVEKKEEPLDKVVLYNLIKRSQEDLLSGCPFLKEVILEIKIHPTFVKYNSVPAGICDFIENENIVKMKIATYPMQRPERVYTLISEKLYSLKRTLTN